MKLMKSRHLILGLMVLMMVFLFASFVAAEEPNQDQLSAPIITGVIDGESYNHSVFAAWNDTEEAGVTITALLVKDGGEATTYEQGTEISEEGNYQLTVTARDTTTGLAASVTVQFSILEEPVGELQSGEQEEEQQQEEIEELLQSLKLPVISGVKDGKSYKGIVKPKWIEEEGFSYVAVLEKDGYNVKKYENGDEIWESGSYILTVTVKSPGDELQATAAVNFMIEKTPYNTPNPGAETIKGKLRALPVHKSKMGFSLLKLVDENMLFKGETTSRLKSDLQARNKLLRGGVTTRAGKSVISKDQAYVYIYFDDTIPISAVEPYINQKINVDEANHLLTAWVELDKLEELSALNGVKKVKLVDEPVIRAAITSAGDVIHQANEVRNNFGQQGEGVKVGVISDSVDNLAITQGRGELPTVTVLRNSYPYSHSDEGIAILEIIHDLAPLAELYFHDCGGDIAGFNLAVTELRQAGCQVIIDDIGWKYEPFFEDGTVAKHVQKEIEDHDIIYISSAGNSADRHYQGVYHNYTLPDGRNFHDFSHGTSEEEKSLIVRMPAGSVIEIILQWDDEFGHSANDYDLWAYDLTNNRYIDENYYNMHNYEQTYGVEVQDGDDDPLENLLWQNNTGGAIDLAINIEYLTGRDDATLEMFFYSYYGAYLFDPNQYLVAEDSVFGHPAVPGAIAVGAIDADDPGHDDIRYYSSQGPTTIRTELDKRPKPDLCGIDGVFVTWGLSGEGTVKFQGTSASAPHVAAIAALLRAHFPTLAYSNEDIKDMLFLSATDKGSVGRDNTFGYGLANGLNAFYTYDNMEPSYLNAFISNGARRIKALFNENIYNNTADLAALKAAVEFAADGTNFLPLQAGDNVSISGKYLFIEFETPLSGIENKVRINGNTLKDANNNVISDIILTESIDSTLPVYMGAVVSNGNRRVTLNFDQNIYNNTPNAQSLKAAVTFAPGGVEFLELQAGDTVNIDGANLVINFVAPLTGDANKIKIAANTIKDEQNIILDTDTITGFIDVSPPQLINTVVSNDNKTITFNFNEDIDNNLADIPALKDAVSIAVNGLDYLPLHEDDTVWINDMELIIDLIAPMEGEQNLLRVASNALKDVAGNVLETPTIVGPFDVAPPAYVSNLLSNGNRRVTINFHENIVNNLENIAALKNAITLAEDGVNYQSLQAGDQITISGTDLIVDFAVFTTGMDNMLMIAGNSLKDSHGNIQTLPVTIGPLILETSPPVYLNAVISNGFKRVSLHFDEELFNNTADGDSLKAAISFASNGIDFIALSETDSVNIAGNILVINFTDIITGDVNKIKVLDSTLKDAANNILESEIITGPLIGASDNAWLSGLSLSTGTLTPGFAFDVFDYTATVTSSSISITPTCAHLGATIKVNDQTVVSGQSSSSISLNLGLNTITVLVTAEDTLHTTTYTIGITRNAPPPPPPSDGGGGGGGGGGMPPPIAPVVVQPILSNPVTEYDKALEKSLQETGIAKIDLSGGSNPIAVLSPSVITQLASLNKPLIVVNKGITIQFYANSLLTPEFRESIFRSGATVNIGASPLREEDKMKIIANTPQGENTGIYSIGGDVFELKAQLTYLGDGGVLVTQEIKKFITPVAVTVNLATLKLNPGQLSGVRLESDSQGNIIPIPLGGAYSPQNSSFTFHTDKFSYYSVMQFKYRTALNMTIGSSAGYVNGSIKDLDAPPTIINDRAMVPLRFIGEALGASFKWDDATKTVSFKVGLKEIKLVVGKSAPGLDSPPVIVNDRTMVPVRYISEAFGAKVNWYPSSSMVTVFKE